MIRYGQTVNNIETPEIEKPKITGYKKQFSIELPRGEEETVEETPIEVPAEQTVEVPVETPVATPTISQTVKPTKGTITFGSGVKVGNMQEVLNKFAEAGINVHVTSGERLSGQAGKAGKKSHHITGNAVDIIPGKGETWESMRKKIKENEGLKNWLRSKKIGIIDETVADTMKKTGATGPHWHIGPDKWALKDFEAIFAKFGAKLPKFQTGGVFSDFDFNNIYSNSVDKIKALQRELGVKDDGIIGNKTITALQRRVGTVADGKWGNNSIAAARSYIQSQQTPQETESNRNSTWQTVKDATKAAWNWGNKSTPATWMTKTKSGKATATEVANERIGTLSNYITEDIGRDANYILAKQEGGEKRPLVLAPEEFENAETEFNKRWISEGGNPAVLNTPDWNNFDTQSLLDRTSYNLNREQAVAYTPATLNVRNIHIKAGTSPQEQLTDKERDQWSREMHLNLTQLAELESQRQQAKTNFLNAATPQQKAIYQDQVRTLSDRIAMASNARSIKYDGESQPHNPIPSGYTSLINRIEQRHNQTGQAELTDDERSQLQSYYDKYGISPQYQTIPWNEKFALDHLHAAGYSYNSDDTSISGMTQKALDARKGLFTPRSYDGKENGTFSMTGYRRGVTMQANQLGDNVSYQFNKPEAVAKKKMFEISPSMAYDWSQGKFHVALSESGNYGTRAASSPLLDKDLMQKIGTIDYQNFNNLSPEQKQSVYSLLESRNFNIKKAPSATDTLKGSSPTYDDSAVVSILRQLQNAGANTSRPGVISGNNSLYHVPMQQKNSYTSPVYGNVITGLQKIGGKYSTFTQDLYDFSMGGVDAFGQGTYYKTAHPLTDRQEKQLGLQ